MQKQEEGPSSSGPAPFAQRAWRVGGPVLEVVALVAAYRQQEALAVMARALVLLGESLVRELVGEEHR